MTKQIMLVDDDQEDLNLMKLALEKEGYKVVTTNNGADALDNLMNEKFDLIIIDIKMPTLSGYDLLRLVREKINHDAKMMYCSIIPEKDVDLENVDGFVQKPFDTENFVEKVKEVVQ